MNIKIYSHKQQQQPSELELETERTGVPPLFSLAIANPITTIASLVVLEGVLPVLPPGHISSQKEEQEQQEQEQPPLNI